MEENNVYAAPKSESIVDEKLLSFGGWLRFYQVINYLSIIFTLLIFAMVSVFYAMGEYAEGEIFEALIAGIELLPDLVVSIMVLKILSKPNKFIPTRVVTLLTYYVGASLLMYGCVYYLFKTEVVVEKPTSFWASVIYYAIWSSYFRKSKRVKAYYGENASG